MNMKDRMHRGELYLPGDSEILEKQTLCLEKLYDFNATRPSEGEKRQKLLKEMFAEIGENCLKIDLASTAGIEGEDVIRANGLPGIHAPESAGRLMADTILRLIEEGAQ